MRIIDKSDVSHGPAVSSLLLNKSNDPAGFESFTIVQLKHDAALFLIRKTTEINRSCKSNATSHLSFVLIKMHHRTL